MKNLNLLMRPLFIVALSCFFVQAAFSEDSTPQVPLKPDQSKKAEIGAGTPIRTKVYIPLSVERYGYELAFFFTSNIGTAVVTITDANDNIEYLDFFNTDEESEFFVDLSELSVGTHFVKISYGSINLIGEFQLP